MNINALEKVRDEILNRREERWNKHHSLPFLDRGRNVDVMDELQSLAEWIDGLIADQEDLEREQAADEE